MMKTKMFEDSPGSTSWMRVVTFIYFVCVAIPASWIIILDTMKRFISESFTWEQVVYSVTLFMIVHVVWIAPKTIQKAIEKQGLIEKMIDKA